MAKEKVNKEIDLAEVLAESLNKQSKDKTVAFFLNSDNVPTNVAGWVSTGSAMLDVAISNRPHGGFPVGRIIEVTGLEQSGKSLLASHVLAHTQKQGGLAVYIDTETAVSQDFLTAIGVDVSKLLYISADSVEDIFQYIETIIEKVRASSKDKMVTILVDSLAAASTMGEIQADYSKDGYATEKAIILSKAMRKITNMIGREKITLIFTNQLRQKMNAMPFSDPWCVDPITTKVKIRYNKNDTNHNEEVSLAELGERFLGIEDYISPTVYNMEDMGIDVLTVDTDGNEVYKPIQNFLIKDAVGEYYTDGKIKVTGNHRFIENNTVVFAKDHPDFNKVEDKMYVADIEVADLNSYLANGRLNHNTTSGGKSIAFHSSVRIRLKSIGTIKAKVNGQDRVIGIKVRAQIVKNRLGPPLRAADFDIYFDSGIDDYGSWLTVAKENKVVSQSGAWYKLVNDKTGEEVKFQSKDWNDILENDDELKEQIYQKICESTILQYKQNPRDLDEVIIDTEVPGEND